MFLGIGSLGFSEFQYGTGNPHQVVHNRALFFWKNFCCPENWGNRPKIGFLTFFIRKGHLNKGGIHKLFLILGGVFNGGKHLKEGGCL